MINNRCYMAQMLGLIKVDAEQLLSSVKTTADLADGVSSKVWCFPEKVAVCFPQVRLAIPPSHARTHAPLSLSHTRFFKTTGARARPCPNPCA